MKEVKKNEFQTSIDNKLNIKMSNMDMKIILNKNTINKKIKGDFMLDRNNINKIILPSFTKKIFKTLSKQK